LEILVTEAPLAKRTPCVRRSPPASNAHKFPDGRVKPSADAGERGRLAFRERDTTRVGLKPESDRAWRRGRRSLPGGSIHPAERKGR
jgi:8-oxo-dGTP pyrophosphatase MutT (NUDIX family)